MDTSKQQMGFRFLRVVVIFLRSLSCKEIHRKVMTSEILNSSTTFFGNFFRKDAMKHTIFHHQFFQVVYSCWPCLVLKVFLITLSSIVLRTIFFLKALVYFLSRISFIHFNYKGCRLFFRKNIQTDHLSYLIVLYLLQQLFLIILVLVFLCFDDIFLPKKRMLTIYF